MPRECAYDPVLEALRNAGAKGLTLRELRTLVGFGERCLYKHLGEMISKGLVDKDQLESQGNVGRPAKVYFCKGLR